MHETIEAIQVALTVWTTVGVGVGGYAFGNRLGKRGHRARTSEVACDAPRLANENEDRLTPLSSESRPLHETISDEPAEQRFEIRLDGELAGFIDYDRGDAAVAFHHTEIDPRFRGRGLAGKLIAFALDASRDAGLSVQPYCPFVRAFADDHPEYHDLIVPTTPLVGSAPKTSEV